MTDETVLSHDNAVDAPVAEGVAPNAAPSAPRDIIAERLAQRMKEREAATASETQNPADSEAGIPKSERKIIEFEQEKPETKILQAEATINVSPIDESIAEATQSIEAAAPILIPRENKERTERPARDRERFPGRNDRRPSREPRADRNADTSPVSQPLPLASRPQRSEKPERREQSDRSQRETKPLAPKTAANAFQRARSLASKIGVSVVIPLYNEQDSLRELTAALREELFKLSEKNYEIIYINDGSTDRSAEILKDIVAGTSKVSTLTFRSNLGKSAALSVGFKEARYGIVITMDADLQDDPKELVNLIAKLDEGFDLVSGWKKKRHDPISKTIPSKFFNFVTGFFAGIKLHDFNCGLKAYRKPVTDALDVYGELHRYLPALAHWQGFRVTEIPVTHHPRRFGKSKFGSSRFFKGFLDLLSIVFTNRYGKRPLHLFGTIGTILSIIGLGINVYVSIEWARGLTTLSNRPILLLGILLMLVGVQLISIGLLGEMIVKNNAKLHDVPYIKDKRKPRPARQTEERGERPDRSERPERRRERNRP